VNPLTIGFVQQSQNNAVNDGKASQSFAQAKFLHSHIERVHEGLEQGSPLQMLHGLAL
jgi:hypothetical protein